MNPKKGLVGKDLKPSPGGSKPVMGKSDKPAKPALGTKGSSAKELPAKGSSNRNLSSEEVAERCRVSVAHVEAWLKEGLLRGSSQSIQIYELEKFRARHHQQILLAQRSPSPSTPSKATSKSLKSQGKKPEPEAPAPAKAKNKPVKSGPSALQRMADAFKNVFKGMLQSERKPAKSEPYVQTKPFLEPEINVGSPPTSRQAPVDPLPEFPPVADINNTAMMVSPFARGQSIEEFTPPPAPSSEVWPSLEDTSRASDPPPPWLANSQEGAFNETLILKSDQIAAAQAQAQASSLGPPPSPASSTLREEKQRNQQLLQQLQEQRRAELELQDEIETLKQRLDLSISSEREIRMQLKRSRQELQVALEDLEQRPPAGGADPEAMRELEQQRAAWEHEKSLLLQQNDQLEQRKTLLEQQIERLRSQAEEIRQHGLQWHQLATQQDQQLKALRTQHSELERQAGSALEDLERRLKDSESQRLRAEALNAKQETLITALENEVATLGRGSNQTHLQLENKSKDRAIQELQFSIDQMQNQMQLLETQQKSQVQRWEQELQASASWVQKLTEAVSQRDRKIQQMEQTLSQTSATGTVRNEEELKSQVMSLRVELTSLRRNYEIVSLQAKNLEKQLQEAQRSSQPEPNPASRTVLSLELKPVSADDPANSNDEEGSFRRRLNARLRSLGPAPEEDLRKRGLEPPPFLELDIPDS